MLVYSEHKNIEVELSSTSGGVFITKWSWAPLIHCTKVSLLESGLWIEIGVEKPQGALDHTLDWQVKYWPKRKKYL